MTAQQAEPIRSEPGPHGAGAAAERAPSVQSEPMAASMQVVAPGSGDAASATAGDGRAGATPEVDAAKVDALRLEASRAEALRVAGRVINMSSGNRAWEAGAASRKPRFGAGPAKQSNRRLTALLAVATVAVMAGAFGIRLPISGLIGSGLTGFVGHDVASDRYHALEGSVARIDADIGALKTSLENTSRQSLAQLSKTNERLEKLEKAQADPNSNIGRLSEALELLRDAPPPIAPVPVAAARMVTKDITGSIAPPAAAAPKVAVGRLPTVQGWMLRKITGGVALIEGRDGLFFEVHAGDPVPGLGRVDAIRRQDGRWVVVTSSGLVVGH